MRKRLLSVLLGAAMTVTAMGGVTVMAAENEEPLPGGGSNIIYVITPSVSNPAFKTEADVATKTCLLYTSPSPRDGLLSRMPSSA